MTTPVVKVEVSSSQAVVTAVCAECPWNSDVKPPRGPSWHTMDTGHRVIAFTEQTHQYRRVDE